MEELFRFSVIRAANRSRAKTVSLARPARTGLEIVPIETFQDLLRTVVQSLTSDNPSAATIWRRLEQEAITHVLNQAPRILADPLWASLQTFLDDLRQTIVDEWTETTVANIESAFEEMRSQSLPGYRLDLADLFIALLIIRRGGISNLETIIRSRGLWSATDLLTNNPTLSEIGDRIRIADLILAGAEALAPPGDAGTPADAQAAVTAALEMALKKTLLFPPDLFSLLRKPMHGVGFRELHVVKQHIRRYELAEIGRIENILKGESRRHTQKHTLSNERETFFETQTTTQKDTELTTTDHVDIKNETQNQIKEDTKVDAGVHAQYDGGSYKIQADLSVAYSRSTDETKKFASDVAKDVTQKAVNKVTERITQSQTTKIIETFEEAEEQAFENQTESNVSGLYQWVEKVYLAQVFNLGRHLLLDIMVPEPGASLLAAANIPSEDQKLPVPPHPLGTVLIDPATKKPSLDSEGHMQLDRPLTPDQLTDVPTTDPGKSFYGDWIAKYQATGIEAPLKYKTVAKAIAAKGEGATSEVLASDIVRLEDGYETIVAKVVATWVHMVPTTGGSDAMLDVSVGPIVLHFDKDTPRPAGPWKNNYVAHQQHIYLAHERDQGQLGVTIAASWVEQVAVNIEVVCQLTTEGFARWQLETYEKIATAWQKLQSDYDSKMASLKMAGAAVGPLGAANPETNRLTERIELKRSCIAIMDNNNATVGGVPPNIAVQDSPDPNNTDPANPDPESPFLPKLPEPILDKSQQLGASVRWFEQALEWENMAYLFYPYFWGRRQTWIQRLKLENDDPIFLKFLQAGYARVVVPVRLGFESAVHFYLYTGLPWLGGELPPVGDETQNPLYLDIAEEIKALTGGGKTGDPIGEPWEYKLPTTLIKLRTDEPMPEWHRVIPPGKQDDRAFASDARDGPWTWKDGAPT